MNLCEGDKMEIFRYILCAIILILALFGFAEYSHTRHPGLILAGIVDIGAVVASLILASWWPLLIGFGLLWLLRLLGLEPR